MLLVRTFALPSKALLDFANTLEIHEKQNAASSSPLLDDRKAADQKFN